MRLIDVDSLNETLCPTCKGRATANEICDTDCYIVKTLKKAPRVDAVRVTRCKSCKHFKRYFETNKWYCEKDNEVRTHLDYCSRSEIENE